MLFGFVHFSYQLGFAYSHPKTLRTTLLFPSLSILMVPLVRRTRLSLKRSIASFLFKIRMIEFFHYFLLVRLFNSNSMDLEDSSALVIFLASLIISERISKHKLLTLLPWQLILQFYLTRTKPWKEHPISNFLLNIDPFLFYYQHQRYRARILQRL